MLDVRCGGGECSDDLRARRAAPRGDKGEQEETGADLEAAGGDVLVGNRVGDEMEQWACDERPLAGAEQCARCGTACHVHRDDQGVRPPDGSLLDVPGAAVRAEDEGTAA